jgi:trk system potassium uptake protein TrkA
LRACQGDINGHVAVKILILGAGQVGGTLAESLAQEAFDITLVDVDGARLQELGMRLDIQTIEGSASHPDVLRRAGADDAEMLIAVTSSDEINMVACQVCYSMFRTPMKIARIRSSAYMEKEGFFHKNHMPIDRLINPEAVVTSQIHELLAMRAVDGGPLVGHALSFLREDMPNADTRVAAIFRRGQSIVPQGSTVIEADDEVFFIAAREHINNVMAELRRAEQPYRRVIIVGGGNIGAKLASEIDQEYGVKLVEVSHDRAQWLAEHLHNTVVIHGNATDRELLLEENIEQCDAFCALTNDDEVNIMSSLMAKRLGVRQVITLITKPAYVDLVQGGEIDVAISPQQATTGSVLSHVRKADVARVHSLRRGAAEAMEAIAHGDISSSYVVGRRISELKLPAGVTIGAVVRGEEVMIAHDDVIIAGDDHVILFLVDKSKVSAVERLFQVSMNFI